MTAIEPGQQSAMAGQQSGTAMLLPVLDHTRSDLARADLTALAGPRHVAAAEYMVRAELDGLPFTSATT